MYLKYLRRNDTLLKYFIYIENIVYTIFPILNIAQIFYSLDILQIKYKCWLNIDFELKILAIKCHVVEIFWTLSIVLIFYSLDVLQIKYQCPLNIGFIMKIFAKKCHIAEILILYWKYCLYNISNAQYIYCPNTLFIEYTSNKIQMLVKYWFCIESICNKMPCCWNISNAQYCLLFYSMDILHIKYQYSLNIAFAMEIFSMKCQIAEI